MKKYIIGGIVILIAAIIWALMKGDDIEEADTSLIATVLYSCDEGRTLSVAYYGSASAATGTVDVALDGGATTTLVQTVSASGIRYANTDESFVFWSKGKEALVMRNNVMDLEYANCTDVASQAK